MKRISGLSSALVLGFAAVLLASSLHSAPATERLIPQEYGTIQSAIDAAADGDTITIRPGRYVENINFLGKAITVRSTDPNDPAIVAATIIDGDKAGSVITFDSGEGKGSVLSGVTVQNGAVIPPSIKGGGISCQFSSPVIKKCRIMNNSALLGGGMYCLESSPEVSNCLVFNNLASEKGGGIYGDYYSSPRLTQCTISRNSALSGGGIYGDDYSSPVIVNSICWDNGSEIGTGVESYPKLSYCDVQGEYPGLGNISADPLFVDPDHGDYRLQGASACKDAGHPRMLDLDNSRSDIGAYAGEGTQDPHLTGISVAADGSGDFTSIQQAIDSALPGDIITVYPGTYRENLVIRGKDISLISQDGANQGQGSTIIDGSQFVQGSKESLGPVVMLVNVTSASRLDGFTIQNGASTRCAGGIHCQNSSPAISHCLITHNSSVDSGGGIGCDQKSSPTISNCTLSENSAFSGGGISCDRSSPTIADCLIISNQATAIEDGRGGGGIFCYNSAPVMTNCTIMNNSASCGGGINCFGPTCRQPKITGCTISQNLASRQGGGIYYQCDALSVNDSTIAQNAADYGGGIYCTWPITGFATNWTITNCIIARNSARSGAGINCSGYDSSIPSPEYNLPAPKITNCTITANSASLYGGGIFSDLSSPIITNSIIWENSPAPITDGLPKSIIHGTRRVDRRAGSVIGTIMDHVPSASPEITYSNIQGGYKGQGNFSLPPLFIDPASGDYHLQYCSPCIDAGCDPRITEAEKDKESISRPWDGDRDGMPGFDLGAFEFSGFVPPIMWVSLNIYSGGEGLNTLPLLSRKVQIAILGSEGFDVADIDPETILLGRKGAELEIAPTRWSYADLQPGSTMAALLGPHNRNGDGCQDLLLTFSIQKLINKVDLRENGQKMICLTLTGKLKDGSLIKGLANASVPMPLKRQTEEF